MLVEEAANVTLQRNSKRVEPYHLFVIHSVYAYTVLQADLGSRKHAIDHTDMLDFLKEIVDGVPDPSAGGTIDLEAEKEARRKQAKQAYRKRKKKGAAEGEIGAEGDGEVEGMEEDDIGPEPETAGGAGSSEWAAVDYAADEDYSDRDWD